MKISSVCIVSVLAVMATAIAQQPMPTATSTPMPPKPTTATEEPKLVPAPSAPPSNESNQPMTRGKFKSQAKKFNPKKVEPMKSPTVTPTPKPVASPK